MLLSTLELVFDLVFIPVEETLQVSESVIGHTFVELALDLSLTGAINTLVVHYKLSRFGVTGWFHTDLVAFVVYFKEVAEEQEDLVSYVLVRDLLFAFFTVHARDMRLVASLVDSRELHVLLASRVRTAENETSDRSVFQELLGFSL